MFSFLILDLIICTAASVNHILKLRWTWWASVCIPTDFSWNERSEMQALQATPRFDRVHGDQDDQIVSESLEV